MKEQECKHLEKLLEAERHKTHTLMKQLDEINSINSQLTMQNSDAKRRLVSLELVYNYVLNLFKQKQTKKRR